jgi:ribokinase
VIGAGANAVLTAAHVAAQEDAISGARVVLAQLESPVEAVAAALAAGRARGAITVLNPAPANASTTQALLALADVLTPNETEFAALVARHLGERIDPADVATLDQARLHALCRRLAPHATVVVTLGAIGCFVSHPEGAPRGDVPGNYRLGAETVRAADTTGAGDAFNGALAASLAGDPDLAFAGHVAFASRYAALSTERAGAAAAMPVLADVHLRFG